MEVFPCIACTTAVTSRQHVISCDRCDRRQHRVCGTGINIHDYRAAVKKKEAISFICQDCSSQQTVEVNVQQVKEDDTNVPTGQMDRNHHDMLPVTYTITEEEKELMVTMILPEAHPADKDDMGELEHRRIPDTSFNEDIPFQRPMTRTLAVEPEDRLPCLLVIDDGPTRYETILNGTRRGAKMLVGSDGHSYNVKRENKTTGFIYWTCSVRTKTYRCPAWVKEIGGTYVSSTITHTHPSDPTKPGKLKVAAKVKTLSADGMFRPSGQIVKEALREMMDLGVNVTAQPENLQRAANRHRTMLKREAIIDNTRNRYRHSDLP